MSDSHHFFLSYPQRTIGALQNHILGFTQRLHSAEVDRRSLRLELSKSKQETSELKSAQSSVESQHRKAKDEARGLEERLQEMKEEVRSFKTIVEKELFLKVIKTLKL